MYARVSRLQMDPSRMDDAIRDVEENAVPEFEQLDGFKGLTVLADRQGGKVVAVGFWESEEAMTASEEKVQGARERAAESGGASEIPEVERFEVAIDTMA